MRPRKKKLRSLFGLTRYRGIVVLSASYFEEKVLPCNATLIEGIYGALVPKEDLWRKVILITLGLGLVAFQKQHIPCSKYH